MKIKNFKLFENNSFDIGDRVKYKYDGEIENVYSGVRRHLNGYVGTIIGKSSDRYVIEFDEEIPDGHDGIGLGNPGHCYCVVPTVLISIGKTKKIKITRPDIDPYNEENWGWIDDDIKESIDNDKIINFYSYFRNQYSIDKDNIINSNLLKNPNIRAHTQGWTSNSTQINRFEKLMKIGVQNGDTVLDYGCGYGDLYQYTKDNNLNINYIGVDINPHFINDAKKLHGKSLFYKIDTFYDIKFNFDWFIASGTFTYNFTMDDIIEVLKYAFKKCNKGVAFNVLKNKKTNEKLNYFDLEDFMNVLRYNFKNVNIINVNDNEDILVYMKK